MADTYLTLTYGNPSSDTTTGGLGAVNAAVAVLVADGASPTQAHVTSLASAVTAAGIGANSPITLVVDTAVITSMSALRNLVDKLVAQAAGYVSAS
jgi:hypothetical protein